MQPTFDFQTSMAVALGSVPAAASELLWVNVGGGLLLAGRDDLLARWSAGSLHDARAN